MKLKINSFVFDISAVNEVSSSEDLLGLCKKNEMIILLAANQNKERLYSTIKHELAHAYIYAYGFDQVDFNEEVMCDFFETYGEKIIKDSKKVYKNLVG